MSKSEMKKLLVRSKAEPVSCAIGIGEDAAALLMLHRTKPGRAVEALLKADFPNARNTRFGTAFVDVDDNPKLVKISLNRPVSGVARRLIKTLKGTGFTKVILVTEDGSVMEQFEEEDEAPVDAAGGAEPAAADAAPVPPPAPPPAPPPPAAEPAAPVSAAELSKELAALVPRLQAAGGSAAQGELAALARKANAEIKTNNLTYAANSLAQLRAALGVAPPPPPAPPPPASGPAGDAAALGKALATLIPEIAKAANGDAARQAVLAKLAKDANVEIKTNNLTYAANTIERLKAALAEGGGAAAAAQPAAASVASSRIAWTGMRAEVQADVDKLRAALAKTYDGQPFAGQIASAFQAKVAPMLARFDDRLGAALDGVAAEADAEKRKALIDAARSLAGEYRAFAEGDALIGDLDDNPFVPLDIRSRAVATLAQVTAALG